MGRLVKKPVRIPDGVTVAAANDVLTVKGPKGKIRIPLRGAPAEIKEGEFWTDAGTLWALTRNAVQGVTEGFTKVLEVEGVGYRAVLEGKDLVLHLGYAQPVRVKVPEGAAVSIEKNAITVSGIDKDLVGRAAAEIRAQKKPEPYKGKGIRYRGEMIRRKAGKKAATSGA